MKKVAVILSGCGVYDGAEIHESVLTLLALDHAGAEAHCVAPDKKQYHVIDHTTGEPSREEKRNMLQEAARIARGEIIALTRLDLSGIDAVIFAGGYGAAKNLTTLAFDGPDYTADSDVVSLVRKAHSDGKPLGFICISPAVAAAAFGAKGVRLTIGNDEGTAGALEAKGAEHVPCAVDDIVVDKKLKIVSTPAYMLAKSITEAERGISKLVDAVLKMA